MDRREYLQTTVASISTALLPTVGTAETSETPPRVPDDPSRNVAWYLWWAEEFDFHIFKVRRPIVLGYLDEWESKHAAHSALDLASRGFYDRDELPAPEPAVYRRMKPPDPIDHLTF